MELADFYGLGLLALLLAGGVAGAFAAAGQPFTRWDWANLRGELLVGLAAAGLRAARLALPAGGAWALAALALGALEVALTAALLVLAASAPAWRSEGLAGLIAVWAVAAAGVAGAALLLRAPVAASCGVALLALGALRAAGAAGDLLGPRRPGWARGALAEGLALAVTLAAGLAMLALPRGRAL